MQHFVKIGQTVAEIAFNGFQNGSCPPSWIVQNFNFQQSQISSGQICVILQNFIKISQLVLQIPRFFNFRDGGGPSSWIFKKNKFLTCRSGSTGKANVHHRTKFHQNVSNCFSKWLPSAILNLRDAFWDHPRRVLGGIYHCAKFGLNLSMVGLLFWIFCVFSLIAPIHARVFFFGGGIWPLNGEISTELRKDTLGLLHGGCRRRIDRQNQCAGTSLIAWKIVLLI